MRETGLIGRCALWLFLLAGGSQAAGIQAGDLDVSGAIDAADMVILANYLAGNLAAFPAQNGQIYAIDPIVGIIRVVAAGTFTQGSPLDEECRDGAGVEAQFAHILTLNLAVMETEVTRQMWADLRATQPTLPSDPTDTDFGAGMDNPVQMVTWCEAVLFANLLSAERGLTRCYYADAGFTTPITSSNYTTGPFYCDFTATGYRLLTEGEWEYCCRAGTATPFWIAEPNFDGGKCSVCDGMLPILQTAAVFCLYNAGGTAEVATKQSNPWGLYDTHGNVWEWCWDWYGTYPSSATDYRGAASGSYRVNRGGSWSSFAHSCRSAYRNSYTPDSRYNVLGFRLARGL